MNDFTCQSICRFNLLGDAETKDCPFYELSTLPSGYIPNDHIECLTKVVGPPLQKKENRRQAPQDTIENLHDPPTSAMPADDTQPTESVSELGHSATPELVEEETSSQPQRKRSLPEAASGSRSDPKRQRIPVDSNSVPLKHWSPRVTPSANQRKSKSSGGKAFWEGYSLADSIRITGISDAELDLIIQNLDNKLSLSHSNPTFLHRFQQAYLHIENQQTCFTEKGRKRMADEPVTFSTYQERDNTLREDDIVNLRWCGGEVDKTAAEMFGLLDLASLFVRNRSNFNDYDSMKIMSYDFADAVKSGIADIQSYPLPTFIIRPKDYTSSEYSTPSVGEKKLALTSGDLARLCFQLQYGDPIGLYWDDGKVKCTNPNIGAATIEILAQLVQECHANRTRYNSLSNYDCTMMFYAQTDREFCLSPIILRDPLDKGKFNKSFLLEAIKNPDPIRAKVFVKKFETTMISSVPLIKFLVAQLISRPGEEPQAIKWRHTAAIRTVRATQNATSIGSTPLPEPAAPPKPDPERQESQHASHGGQPPTKEKSQQASLDGKPQQRQARTIPGNCNLSLDSPYALPLPNNPDGLYSFDSEEVAELRPVVVPNVNTGSMESNSSAGGSAPSLVHSEVSDEDALGPFTPRLDPQSDNDIDPVSAHLLDTKVHDSKSKSQQSSPFKLPTPLVRVQLVSWLGSGRVYDAYSGFMMGVGVSGRIPVAVKIVNLAECDEPKRNCRASARKSVFDEAEFYTHGLRSLRKQSLVPEFYGVWARGNIMVMILEHAGHAMANPELQDMHRVKLAYLQLHDLGIIHNDVDPRHWLKSEDGNIRLIDFEGSCQVGSKELAKELEEGEVNKVTAGAIRFSSNI